MSERKRTCGCGAEAEGLYSVTIPGKSPQNQWLCQRHAQDALDDYLGMVSDANATVKKVDPPLVPTPKELADNWDGLSPEAQAKYRRRTEKLMNQRLDRMMDRNDLETDWMPKNIPSGPTKEYHESMEELGRLMRGAKCVYCGDDAHYTETATLNGRQISNDVCRRHSSWKEKTNAVDKAREAVEELGQAAVTAKQSADDFGDSMKGLLELTPAEKSRADRYEDVIEDTLDANIGEDLIQVDLKSIPSTIIADYLVDRFKGWDVETDTKSTVWIFRAR